MADKIFLEQRNAKEHSREERKDAIKDCTSRGHDTPHTSRVITTVQYEYEESRVMLVLVRLSVTRGPIPTSIPDCD